MSDTPKVVEINLNPFQGLKRAGITLGSPFRFVEINLNPFQGLKPNPCTARVSEWTVEINLNPFQGLKPSNGLNFSMCEGR